VLGNGGRFVCSMCGHVYIFGANENTSLKLDYLAIHQVIETKVEAHIT